jgi:outer membrane protein X
MMRKRIPTSLASLRVWGLAALFLLFFVGSSVTASAQFMRAADVKTNFRCDPGFGIGFTMHLVDEVDIAPSFNYYFASGPNLWGLDADFHYNFHVAPRWEVYPLAGVGLLYNHTKKHHEDLLVTEHTYKSHLRPAVNAGVGAAFEIDNDWAVKGELRYQGVKDHSDLYVTVGLSYKF